MSETPRTDAVKICNTYTKTDTVGAWFARALERELAAANARVKRLEEAGDAMAETTTTTDAIAWRRAKEAKP
jgi:hypothetical protein